MSHHHDRDAAIEWARSILKEDFAVLDTETTGLDSDAEACQIAVVDRHGRVLLDSLVKPRSPIPAAATRIHGITNEMVGDAPGFEAVYLQLLPKIGNKALLIYNGDFDWRIIQQSLRAAGVKNTEEMHPAGDGHCVMSWFAQFYGEWNNFYGCYTWKKLTIAAAYLDIPTRGAHGAAADALMTLRVVEKMAAARLSTEAE